MMVDGEALREFGWTIQKLIQGEHLDRDLSYRMFKEILLDRQPDLQQGAFLGALVTKGETAEEVAGAWSAIDEHDTTHVTGRFDFPVLENSGTGMDRLKTFNISSAAAVVAAACGARIARHGARALSSRCGAVDILEAVGIDVECGVPLVESSIASCGIGLFNGMSTEVHPRALGRILSQIRFGSTLNIAASLANPARPTLAVRGVYHPSRIELVARIMRTIGYQRGMVVFGYDDTGTTGMDELSILGRTDVLEFHPDGHEERYELTPEMLGLARGEYALLAPLPDIAAEVRRFMLILSGQGPAVCEDSVCLNAAAILRVYGIEEDWRRGVVQCREALQSGQALAKLREWVLAQNRSPERGLARLDSLVTGVTSLSV